MIEGDKLLDNLVEDGWLKSPNIIDAFHAIHRNDFVPKDAQKDAFLNTALSIGWDQTISQPLTVAFMLELLEPKSDQKILEIGYGSSWQTCLLAHIVGKHGKVFAIEIVPELCKFGSENIAKYNFIKEGIVECFCQDATEGLEDQAPFERIIAAASAFSGIPDTWKDQLGIGGRIVAPVGQSIFLFIKNPDGSFEEKEFPGFIFVPLIKGK